MSDYFDRFELAMDSALIRGAHRSWYRQAVAARSRRMVAAVLASSAILAPASVAAGVVVLESHPEVVCSADHQSDAHASLVNATLPKWLPSTGS